MVSVMRPVSGVERHLTLAELAEQASGMFGVLDRRHLACGGSVVDAGRAIGAVGELAKCLPRLLIELNTELARHQANGLCPAPGGEGSQPGSETAVRSARLALAEATTAARILARHLVDTGQAIAVFTDGDGVEIR